MGTCALQYRAAKGGICAGVRYYLGINALNYTVFITAKGKFHIHGMALWVYQQALRPGKLYLYGALCKVGNQRRVMLHGNVFLAAKAATHQLILNAYLLQHQAQHGHYLVLGIVYALVGGINLYAVSIRERHGTFRLKECMLGIGGGVFFGQHILGAGNSFLCIAAGYVLISKEISLLEQILVFVHNGRTLCHSLIGRAHRGKHLVFHVYQLLGLLQYFRSFRRNYTDGIAKIVGNAAHGDQRIPVLFKMANLNISGDIRGGKHTNHAGQRLCGGGINGQHAGSGVL